MVSKTIHRKKIFYFWEKTELSGEVWGIKSYSPGLFFGKVSSKGVKSGLRSQPKLRGGDGQYIGAKIYINTYMRSWKWEAWSTRTGQCSRPKIQRSREPEPRKNDNCSLKVQPECRLVTGARGWGVQGSSLPPSRDSWKGGRDFGGGNLRRPCGPRKGP